MRVSKPFLEQSILYHLRENRIDHPPSQKVNGRVVLGSICTRCGPRTDDWTSSAAMIGRRPNRKELRTSSIHHVFCSDLRRQTRYEEKIRAQPLDSSILFGSCVVQIMSCSSYCIL